MLFLKSTKQNLQTSTKKKMENNVKFLFKLWSFLKKINILLQSFYAHTQVILRTNQPSRTKCKNWKLETKSLKTRRKRAPF